MMQIFADYLKLTDNPKRFVNLSVTQMMNYYKIHGHIDRFTYNEETGKGSMEGNPFDICLNDIGLETENQKSYGTSLNSVIDEFLYEGTRYTSPIRRSIISLPTYPSRISRIGSELGWWTGSRVLT